MNRTNIISEGLKDILKEKIEETIIDIAFANRDFVCSRCLRTIDNLYETLELLGCDHKPIVEEVNQILGK